MTEKKNEYKENLFTRETLGVTVSVFSAVLLLILFTRSAVFGSVGAAISSFLLGVFGFAAFPLLAYVLFRSVLFTINKKPPLGLRTGLLVFLALVSLALIVHAATVADVELGTFADYIAYCFGAAESSAYAGTGAGVIGALLTYAVLTATGTTGSYVIFAVLMILFVYASFTSFRAGREAARRRASGDEEEILKENLKKKKKLSLHVRGTRSYPVNLDFDAIRAANGAPTAADADYVGENGTYYAVTSEAGNEGQAEDNSFAPGPAFVPPQSEPSYPRYEESSYPRYGGAEAVSAPPSVYGVPRESVSSPRAGYAADEKKEYALSDVPNLDRETRREILFDSDPDNFRSANLIFDRDSRFNNRPSSRQTPRPNTAYKGVGEAKKGERRVFRDGSYILRDASEEPKSYLDEYQKEKDDGAVGLHSVRVYGADDTRRELDISGEYRSNEPTRRPFDAPAEPPERIKEEKPQEDNFLRPDGGRTSSFSYNPYEPARENPPVQEAERPSAEEPRAPLIRPMREQRERPFPPRETPAAEQTADGGRAGGEQPASESPRERFGRVRGGGEDTPEKRAMRDSLLNKPSSPDSGNGGYFSSSLDLGGTDRRKTAEEPPAPPVKRQAEASDIESEPSSFLDFDEEESDSVLQEDDSLVSPFDEPKKEEKLPPTAPERFRMAEENERRPETGNKARGMGVFGKTDFTAHKEYVRPPLMLFKEYSSRVVGNMDEVEQNKRIIIETLAAYRIQADINSVIAGPTFTRYDVTVPVSVSSKKVAGCATEIAMALHSRDGVNIFPNLENGTNAIEVPNKTRATVGLGSVLQGKEFQNAKPDVLMFAIGKDVEGRNIYGRIAKMTHLLVAGATGSGKSCFLNSLILSLIVRYTPQELRLILIDPKKIEFAIYSNLPHLMINEIITEATKVVATLNWAIEEMERRYMLFNQMMSSGKLVRNIDEYNENVKTENEKLPKIVIIIDELADLMAVAKKDIEDRVSRLTAKSRACGIHMIIATQRPSVDVITGVIKSNLPTRFAFKVAAEVDSRTILDEQGAEKLLGNGDLLYKTASMYSPARVQGAFVSSSEVQSVVEYIKMNNEAYYDNSVAESINNQANEESDELSGDAPQEATLEPVYIDALRFIVQQGSASISMIQRKFSVGYNKAGRIIEWMESMGYISAFDGAKSRKVLITMEDFKNKYEDGGEE